MKLIDIFTTAGLKPSSGEYGLEIETETASGNDYPPNFFIPSGTDSKGNNRYVIPMTSFCAVDDGSLRNFGKEFVLVEPLKYADLVSELGSFHELTKDIPFIKDAPATSIHVHVNMQDESLTVLMNYIILWTMFENVLLEYSGRRANLFALPTRCAEGSVKNIKAMINKIVELDPQAIFHNEVHAKYYALNLAPLWRFGSVEIRSMRGTTDVKEIIEWVSILDCILRFAKTPGLLPTGIVGLMKESDPITTVFGDLRQKLRTGNEDALVRRNISYVLDLVEECPDWSTFGEYPLPEKPKRGRKKVIPVLSEQGTFAQAMAGSIGSTLSMSQPPDMVIFDDIVDQSGHFDPGNPNGDD